MERNDNIYTLVNFSLCDVENADVLRANYPTLIFSRISTGIYTVQVPEGEEAAFARLQENLNIISEPTVFGLNASDAFEASNISIFHDYPYGTLRGNGILIGFVDTGIDYTNPLFQNADGSTRIVSIWDQTIEGNPPSAYNYGSVYSEANINSALQNEVPLSVVPSRDENGHGTFLAGVAAGNDQSGAETFTGGAPDAGIAMVKLRPASERVRNLYLVKTGEPAYQNNDILTGLNYLEQLSVERNQPMVICIGLGNNFGAHNGTDILEGYLENLSVTPDVIYVVAAGNEGSSGHHYRGQVAIGQSEDIEINVGDNDEGFIMLLWADVGNRVSIQIKSPLGQVINRIPILSQQDQSFNFNLENTRLTVRYISPDPQSGNEEVSIRLEAPTPGIWTLTVFAENIIDGIFHVWLPRRGFIEETTRFLRPEPNTTVQIPGTQRFSIVVGAYDYLDDSVYVASGRGPTTDGIIKPDLIAPGVNVQGPTPGGGFTTYIGTSTAAAVTASACALLLQWGSVNQKLPEVNTRIARSILTQGARRQRGVVYPNNIEGYGRLDLQNSLANI